jgi:hypothetical protein
VRTGAQTLNVNFSIPVGTGYLMDAVGTTGQLSYGGAFTFPSTISSVISITGQTPSWTEGDRYNYIFKWNVSSGSTCSRLPVIATVGSGCSSLPVAFQDIAVSKEAGKAKISWITSWELNNDYFEVQKSKDGIDFISIERVEGTGTATNQNYYSFIDPEYLAGTAYYRIAQIDMDRSIHYSEVVSIEGDNTIQVSPNPFSEYTIISIPESPSIVTVKVYDLAGNSILSEEYYSANGSIQIGETLKEGAYIIQVISEAAVYNQRIIKVN